jgi:hypothetical protein
MASQQPNNNTKLPYDPIDTPRPNTSLQPSDVDGSADRDLIAIAVSPRSNSNQRSNVAKISHDKRRTNKVNKRTTTGAKIMNALYRNSDGRGGKKWGYAISFARRDGVTTVVRATLGLKKAGSSDLLHWDDGSDIGDEFLGSFRDLCTIPNDRDAHRDPPGGNIFQGLLFGRRVLTPDHINAKLVLNKAGNWIADEWTEVTRDLISEANEELPVGIFEDMKRHRAMKAAQEDLQRQECELARREKDMELRERALERRESAAAGHPDVALA